MAPEEPMPSIPCWSSIGFQPGSGATSDPRPLGTMSPTHPEGAGVKEEFPEEIEEQEQEQDKDQDPHHNPTPCLCLSFLSFAFIIFPFFLLVFFLPFPLLPYPLAALGRGTPPPQGTNIPAPPYHTRLTLLSFLEPVPLVVDSSQTVVAESSALSFLEPTSPMKRCSAAPPLAAAESRDGAPPFGDRSQSMSPGTGAPPFGDPVPGPWAPPGPKQDPEFTQGWVPMGVQSQGEPIGSHGRGRPLVTNRSESGLQDHVAVDDASVHIAPGPLAERPFAHSAGPDRQQLRASRRAGHRTTVGQQGQHHTTKPI